MGEPEDKYIQLIGSSNLDRFRNRSLAVIPVENKDMIPVIGAALQAGSLVLPIVDQVVHAGEQLAYIKMPGGVNASSCFARQDGFGGFTLSAHDAAGSFVNGSWVPAALSPEIMAMAGFAFAAVMIVEKQISEINKRLGVIESDVKGVIETLGIRRRSEIEGLYDRILNDYVARYDEYIEDPEKLRAARIEIEGSLTDISKLWAEQKNILKALGEHLAETKRPKRPALEEFIDRFNDSEQNAATVFELSCALDQVRMFYDRDVSERRMERERQHAARRRDEYLAIHNNTLSLLTSKIKEFEGAPLALASEDKLDKRNGLPANAIEGAMQSAGGLIERLTKQTPWDAADEQTDKDIDELLAKVPSASGSSLCESAFTRADSSLRQMSSVFSKADAMLFDGENIYLLEAGEVESNSQDDTDLD